ncbi:MAG: type B 50S ribosomal protein L31 [Oligoflexia bacterium]
MKQGIHPVYREVIYRDVSSGYSFLTRSTAQAKENAVWEDGQEYPVVKVEVSSASHPFFTGKERLLDTEGRVERFKRRYANASKKEK